MMFKSPTWLPAITQEDLSGTGTLGDFVLHGSSASASGSPIDPAVLVSAHSHESKTPRQLAQDVEALATALADDLQWAPNEPVHGGKVIAILSENTIDYLTCCWAIHRLGGTCLLLHGSTSPTENAKHLKHSNCTTLIVSPALLESGRAAAALASVDESSGRWYLTQPLTTDSTGIETNGSNGADRTNGVTHHTNGTSQKLKSIDELLDLGKTLTALPALGWPIEEAQAHVAYLCPTSGTSGVQKLARLTHRSVIANILQIVALESAMRRRDVDVVLGVLPLSHVQGIVASHASIYVRDRFILHTKFDMKEAMASIQVHHVNRLYLVPSVLAALVGNPFLFKVFDVSSVDSIFVGAGNVSAELHAKTKAVQPGWNIVTGYGLTESPAAVAMSSPQEYMPGSVGILLPLYHARLQRQDGSGVEAFDEPGELLLSSPNQASGYLGDDKATAATFRDGWLHTGDVALFRQSAKGDSHLYIVDRLRDMIKVKGMQVSPIAIEECLRQHPGIADVAVIGMPDDLAGERAKAFVVPANPASQVGEADETAALFEQWDEHVQSKLTEPHWLRGRYELLEALPRNPSGKVSKGVLRAR